ncbi:MAG: hypothetical protein A3J38_04750 [Gammaproteobacteria bacterium RIFCSPHIGHO2_12_FULL_45_9]|nr:MAG: hypothetical protein A3J38_04750 [Gammaproteobacteria bacterium RIFCSPHIGHO2_12_FULL_45_9]
MSQSMKKKRILTGIGIVLGIGVSVCLGIGLALLSIPLLMTLAAVASIGVIGFASYIGYQRYHHTNSSSESLTPQTARSSESLTHTSLATQAPGVVTQPMMVSPHASCRINPCAVRAQLQVDRLDIRSLLGLSLSATKAECMERCRKQLLYWHPDKNADIKTVCTLPDSDPQQRQTRLCVEFWIQVYQQVSQWNSAEGACVVALPSHTTVSRSPRSQEDFWQHILRCYERAEAIYHNMDDRITALQQDFGTIRQQQEGLHTGFVSISSAQGRIEKQQENIANGIKKLSLGIYAQWMKAWHKKECEQHVSNRRRFSLFFEPQTSYAEIKNTLAKWSVKKSALGLAQKAEKPVIADPQHLENRQRLSFFCQAHNLTLFNRYTTVKPSRPTNPEMMQRLSL